MYIYITNKDAAVRPRRIREPRELAAHAEAPRRCWYV